MTIRRWSDTVLAVYVDDDTNPFGGHLVEVVDAQAFQQDSNHEHGYDKGTPGRDGLRRTSRYRT
jgi:hypothetical protein